MKETINTILRKVGLKAVEVKLEQMRLADGVTVIEAELFEVGEPVFVITEDAQIALPIGEYVLEDERVLVVLEEGIIAEIKEQEEEVEEVEAPVAEVPETEMAQPQAPTAKKVIESIVKETQFSSSEKDAKIAELEARIAELTKVELSDDAPAAEPINHNPENAQPIEVFRYAKNSAQSPLDRVLTKLYK
jgi:non-homologous end joining protein Ku